MDKIENNTHLLKQCRRLNGGLTIIHRTVHGTRDVVIIVTQDRVDFRRWKGEAITAARRMMGDMVKVSGTIPLIRSFIHRRVVIDYGGMLLNPPIVHQRVNCRCLENGRHVGEMFEFRLRFNGGSGMGMDRLRRIKFHIFAAALMVPAILFRFLRKASVWISKGFEWWRRRKGMRGGWSGRRRQSVAATRRILRIAEFRSGRWRSDHWVGRFRCATATLLSGTSCRTSVLLLLRSSCLRTLSTGMRAKMFFKNFSSNGKGGR